MHSVSISYSHKDEKWKDRVVSQMAVMQRAGRYEFKVWHDSKIGLGKNYKD